MTEPFRFSNGQLAYSVQDLIGVCQQSPDEGINYLKRGDFENWLAYLGEEELSKKAQAVRHTSLSDEDKLKQFLATLESPKTTTTPPPQTKVEATQPSQTAPKPAAVKSEVGTTQTSPKTKKKESQNPISQLFKAIQSLFAGGK